MPAGTNPGFGPDTRTEDLRFCVPCDEWYDRARGVHVCPYKDGPPPPPTVGAALYTALAATWALWVLGIAAAAHYWLGWF